MICLMPIGPERDVWVIAWRADGSYRYRTSLGGWSWQFGAAARYTAEHASRVLPTMLASLPA